MQEAAIAGQRRQKVCRLHSLYVFKNFTRLTDFSRLLDTARAHLPAEKLTIIRDSDRVQVLDGDIEKAGLGLEEEKLLEIQSTVTVYIHAASSINLQRSLKSIATSVVEPSLAIAEIALSSPRMAQFVYISTAYANAHLHNLHDGIDTVINEEIYPLRPASGDSTDLEYADLRASSDPPEYRVHKFPFPYTYAKHLTERLLLQRFTKQERSSSLLILRPSLIGPALQEPFPYYEIPGSAPATSLLAVLIPTLSWRMSFASRFPDPYNQSTFDEVPVDLAVNRLLMHLSRKTSGIVHAVAGREARRTFADLWTGTMAERKLPWSPRLVWHADLDWRDPSLHPIARLFVIIGTSYVFEARATEQLWTEMTEEERLIFPLWLRNPEQNADRFMRRAAFTSLVKRYFVKKKLPGVFLKLLLRDPIAAAF